MTFEEFEQRAHHGQWNFDELLRWYWELQKETTENRVRLELQVNDLEQRVNYLENGLEQLLADPDHPDELGQDLSDFLDTYYSEVVGVPDQPGLPNEVNKLVDKVLNEYK